MFLCDSICNYRSTEPVWFRFFRGLFAITLTVIIIFYSKTQYQKINIEASIAIKLEDTVGLGLNMTICTAGIYNSINDVNIPRHTINYDITHRRLNVSLDEREIWLNITFNINNISDLYVYDDSEPYCNPNIIPNNLLSLNFESFQYLFLNKADPDLNYSINNIIDTAHFSLYLGRAYFISYKPIIVDKDVKLNLQLEQLPIQLESNEVNLKIFPHKLSNPFTARFEKTKKFDYTDLISNLGGFYGAIAGIFYLFFGMQRLEPWGLAQKYLFSCTHCRKSLKRNFARKYVSSAGIPLVEKVNKRPEGSSLEERVQILETLLRDYYLDDYYLKKVKYVRINHKRLLKKYEEIDRQDNEDTVNTESTEPDDSLV
ncbi:hypothetical protein RhiirA5_420767 [Rhizophagus irregularis]|uniref:Uncharacterized protein n=4 Tax=Rhizophagus irregularis TaxID=588596 RepID=A0A2N0PFG6_9GLOM|nr:hypothetical protein RirG_000160 [Rhizophagus irregularis DAOM 197198w]PKC05568.1 hypothetical protein RhiirA5_420767 [Rhizophagus irregularis]GBC53726.1 hypothetical protein GLOIN_2v1873134 [Rhizophagus irregularis DAOM 181602=DAOM 197198]UZO12685.1 hypothetical protein OCT59_004209 [Rhizophagus irregularis]CAB4484993.1 unnamed protein product [Rhizophagus irregularis]